MPVKPPVGLSQIDPNHPLARGMVGCWLFNEGGGSRAFDLVKKNHGTLTNMDPATDWVNSPVGKCLDFDGTNDSVDQSTLYTLAAWSAVFFIKTTKTGVQVLLGGTNSNSNLSIALTDNTFRCREGAENLTISLTTTIPSGEWIQVVITRSMSTIIRAYIDGQDVTSGSPTFASNAKTLRHIGRRSDSSATLFFQGQMGYAYLSQRALTAAEIRQLYVDPFCFLRKSRTVAFTSSPGLHLTEGFEGAGAPSGWTSTGSPDYDYTSTVLADAQSLKVVRSPSFDEARWNIGQDCDELWGRFMFRTPALPASAQGIFYVLDSGGSDLLEIKLLTTGKLSINGGLVSTTAAMLANTTYYVWWHYAKGAGANSEADVWFSESNSRPADGSFWHHSIANGAETAQGRNLSFTATGADGTLIFDNADVADSDLYTNAGNISGFSGFAFTAGGSLSGAAAISGASHLSFSAGGTASGIGALSGSANVTVSAGGSLSGTGALSGSTVLVFNAGATAIGIGALSGGSVITLNCAATAQGALQMVGSSTLTFSAGGSLTAGASLPTIRHPVYASLRAAHAYTYLIDSKTRSDLTPAHTYTELT